MVRPGFVHTKMTEGMKPAPLSVQPEDVAAVVVDAVGKRKELVWAPAPMRVLMSVLRHIPRAIFRRPRCRNSRSRAGRMSASRR